MELHTQLHGIEAALVEFRDVTLEFLEVHLLALFYFFEEVVWSFDQFVESARVAWEGVVVRFPDALKIATPAILEDPAFERTFPAGLFRRDVPLQLGCFPIHFVDVDVEHRVLFGIEVAIVEDPAV